MKFGVADFGMSVWDGGLYDLQSRLEGLKAIGYDGIERFEANCAADALTKASLFRRLGMDFSTCRGPKNMDSMEWTAGLGKPYVWIALSDAVRTTDMNKYLRQCNSFVAGCKTWGISGILHNHLGTRIENQEEVHLFMEKCPDAELLLDIGHLYGAGGDPVEIIHKYADRIAAVHFKDIEMKDESIGLDKWYDRLRFCELGAGTPGLVDYDACVKALCEVGYDKWVLVEHDTHTDDPFKQLKISLDRLKESFAKYQK